MWSPVPRLIQTAEGMTLLPANIDLAGAEAMLLMRAGAEYALKRALAKLTGAAPAATSDEAFDVVIIDCPPSLGVLTLNGLTAADEVIVPLQCETLAHRGVGQFLRTINDVQQITNPDLKMLGALPTLYDARTTHSRDVLLDVADRYDLPVLAPPIPRTVRFAEASASGSSVLAGRKNKGANAYRELADALLKHWKNRQGAGHLHPGGLAVHRRPASATTVSRALLDERRTGRGRHDRGVRRCPVQVDVPYPGAGFGVEHVVAVGDRDQQFTRPSWCPGRSARRPLRARRCTCSAGRRLRRPAPESPVHQVIRSPARDIVAAFEAVRRSAACSR